MGIDVPADARYLQVLRVATAAAGVEVMDDFDRINDLRLAIDELAAAVMEAARPGARLAVEIWPSNSAVNVCGRVRGGGGPPVLSELGRMLVASVAQDHRLAQEGDDLVFELLLDAHRPTPG